MRKTVICKTLYVNHDYSYCFIVTEGWDRPNNKEHDFIIGGMLDMIANEERYEEYPDRYETFFDYDENGWFSCRLVRCDISSAERLDHLAIYRVTDGKFAKQLESLSLRQSLYGDSYYTSSKRIQSLFAMLENMKELTDHTIIDSSYRPAAIAVSFK